MYFTTILQPFLKEILLDDSCHKKKIKTNEPNLLKYIRTVSFSQNDLKAYLISDLLPFK
jgi:hypothetical protein